MAVDRFVAPAKPALPPSMAVVTRESGVEVASHDLRRVVAQGCAVYEPKDGILVVFNDVGVIWPKSVFVQ